jgi:hypothetical protein
MDYAVRFITKHLGSERLVRTGVWAVLLAASAGLFALGAVIAVVSRKEPLPPKRRSRIEPFRD